MANIPEYVRRSNDEILVVVMIESVDALSNVEQIAAVTGVDVLHIGTADLSHSMGRPLADVGDALDRVLAAVNRHSVFVGYPTGSPERMEQLAKQGVRYFEISSPDYLLREVYAKQISETRRRLAADFSD